MDTTDLIIVWEFANDNKVEHWDVTKMGKLWLCLKLLLAPFYQKRLSLVQLPLHFPKRALSERSRSSNHLIKLHNEGYILDKSQKSASCYIKREWICTLRRVYSGLLATWNGYWILFFWIVKCWTTLNFFNIIWIQNEWPKLH